MDKKRQVWERVLEESAAEDIYSSHSSEEERLQYCAETYSAKPGSSWEELVESLYYNQSTLRRPEVHRLYIHFNVSSPFVLHVWGIMICITCGRSQKF